MYQYKAKAERVVDGDTIDVTIDLGFKITTHQRIRLAGIDTPEVYSVKKDSDEHRRGIAGTISQSVADWIMLIKRIDLYNKSRMTGNRFTH